MEKKLKPQEKVERFMIKPHYGLFLGITITKDTDVEDETEDGKVHQIIKGTTFTTIKKDEIEKDGLKIIEDSKLTVEVPEGTRLVWIEGQGYILPDFEPKTTKEVIEYMVCIKEF